MTIAVHVPTALRGYCQGASQLSVMASSVRAALEELQQQHPAIYRGVCDETGAIRRHIHLFVNNDFLHEREGLDTALEPGDLLTIMPAVSGG